MGEVGAFDRDAVPRAMEIFKLSAKTGQKKQTCFITQDPEGERLEVVARKYTDKKDRTAFLNRVEKQALAGKYYSCMQLKQSFININCRN